jgi:hypothetical protein
VEHAELVAPGVAYDPEVKAALLLMVIAGRAQRLQALDLGLNLCPEADTALRDRLDALYVAGAQAESGVVIELRRDASRPQRCPERGERRR